MEFRNVQENAAGGLDAEISHPVLGWIPNTIPLGSDFEAEIRGSGEVIAPFVAPLPTSDDVNAERERRVFLGFDAQVPGLPQSIRLTGDDQTKTNLQALATAAMLRSGVGDTQTITRYRDDNDIIHELVPAQVIVLFSLGAAFVDAVFQASWTLKDHSGGIPANFTDDQHWPTS